MRHFCALYAVALSVCGALAAAELAVEQGEQLEGGRPECDEGLVATDDGICIPDDSYDDYFYGSDYSVEDNKDANGVLEQWYCAVEFGQVWCDGVCIDPSEDASTCKVKCSPHVSDTGEVGCKPGRIVGVETPLCCKYSTEVWCEAAVASELPIPGFCVQKEDEAEHECVSTCIVLDGGELDCTTTASRGLAYSDDDECRGQATGGSWVVPVPRRRWCRRSRYRC